MVSRCGDCTSCKIWRCDSINILKLHFFCLTFLCGALYVNRVHRFFVLCGGSHIIYLCERNRLTLN